ncbi:MAG TPA: hypothetical protein VJC08_05250, partial [bacterium]|nr:hypothetical protein [bacterium]
MSATQAVRSMYEGLQFHKPVEIAGQKASNLYELHKFMQLAKRKARYENENRVPNWNNEDMQKYEDRNFDIFFLEMQTTVTQQLLDTYQNENLTYEKLSELQRGIFKVLSGYPIENEMDESQEFRFQDLLETEREEGVQIGKQIREEDYREFFKNNSLQVSASQWLERMLRKTEFDDKKLEIEDVRKKIESRKRVWGLYQQYWKPIGLRVDTSQISYLAELGKDERFRPFFAREEGADEKFFQHARYVQGLMRKNLGRNIPFNELITYLTTYNYDVRNYWWRSLGGRSDWIGRWRMTNRFSRMDQADPEKLRDMFVPGHSTIDDISMLNAGGKDPYNWHENLRFALETFAEKNELNPEDFEFKTSYKADEFRIKLLGLLGKGRADDRLRDSQLMAKTSRINANLRTFVFGEPHFFDLSDLEENEKKMQEYIIRNVMGNPSRRSVNAEYLALNNEDFISEVARRFYAESLGKEKLAPYVNLLNDYDTTGGKKGAGREQILAIFNDFSTVWKARLLDDFQIRADKETVLRIVSDERLNGNVSRFRKMTFTALGHFLDRLDKGKTVPLTLEERTLMSPNALVDKWVSDFGIREHLPREYWEGSESKLVAAMVRGHICSRSVKRLLADYRVLVDIVKAPQHRMPWMGPDHPITVKEAESLLRLLDDVYDMNLQENGYIAMPQKPRTEREKWIFETMSGHISFAPIRDVRDENYKRFRMQNPNYIAMNNGPDSPVTIITDIEKNQQKSNLELLFLLAGYLAGAYAFFQAFGLIVWSHLAGFFQKLSAELELATEDDTTGIALEDLQ